MEETLGYRLQEARKNAGLTQAQVADRLFITTQSVSAWECGSSTPDIAKLPELAELYGVTADWLLSGTIPSPEIIEVTSDLSDRLFNEQHMSTYVSAYCTAKQLYQTKRALAFAWEKHAGQFRKGRSKERVPYIYHPLVLTCHALALGLEDDNLLSACLLHDVIEDCGVAPEELPVNEETRDIVELLTLPEDDDDPEELQAYYDGIAADRTATMVKLLDRCANVSNMATAFSDEHLAEYIKETQQYIYPLMEHARKAYPEFSNQLFLIRYHMTSVIEALRHHMRSSL